MGVEPFLVASTLLCAVGQILVRNLFPRCKEEYVPTSSELKKIGLSQEEHKGLKLFRPKGCKFCGQTGFRGRSGIFELMWVDEKIKELIIARSHSSVLRKQAESLGMMTLRKAGLSRILKGETSVLEVMRVTQEV
jgi:general secretion pathway protein E